MEDHRNPITPLSRSTSINNRINLKSQSDSILPTLKKSLSRNTILNNTMNNNHSPTRPYFPSNSSNYIGTSFDTRFANKYYNKNLPPTTHSTHEQRQLITESAIYPDSSLIQSDYRKTPHSSTAPAGDGRSIMSGSESTRSITTNNKRKKKQTTASSFVNPTDIFAQNLSDAVMDADDSDDFVESYVYRDKPKSIITNSIAGSYNIPSWAYSNEGVLLDSSFLPHHPQSYQCSQHPPSHNPAYPPHHQHCHNDRYYSSTGTESNTDGCDSSVCHKEKYYSSRRPGLRPATSDLQCSQMRSIPSFTNTGRKLRPYKANTINYYPYSDEEVTPLVRRPRRRKGTSSHSANASKRSLCTLCWLLFCFISILSSIWLILIIYASPLMEVEVVGISNVLGTQKELIFNLQVRARNSNWWTVRMTHAAFSVFASSRYVPTGLLSVNDTDIDLIHEQGADPAEFLGTIYQLEDPLIYQAGSPFNPVISTATSQIQIKSPGSTKDDNSGNERWSLLIRYPYELTVRGVLKYQLSPFLPYLSQLHSVRVCKMSRVDPSTGKISDDVSLPEKSICDDPSPVEDTNHVF
ncbi:hypothetical protein BDB01DRAFT_786677 [Pilobolus umbonatus]|nr:hypothetical protein BDB01DRAFT_786677 [Pilobolus umbonatus]